MKYLLLLLVAVLPLSGFVETACSQATGGSADSGWNATFTALDEERVSEAGVAVSIVFDDSGSMADHDKMRMAKQAFRTWIADAPVTYRFGLTALNAGRLAELKRDNKAAILAAVDKLQPGGDTPLADTIAKVGKEISKRRSTGSPYERQVMVVLTDGEDNTSRGIPGVQKEMENLRRAGVEVIAFGYQGEGQYMKASATHFFSPDNAEDIRRGLNIISAEVGDTSDVLVDDATRAVMLHPARLSEPFIPSAGTPPPSPTIAPTSRDTRDTPIPRPATKKSAWGHLSIGRIVVIACVAYFVFGRGKKK